MTEPYLQEQVNLVKRYLEEKYRLNFKDLRKLDDYLYINVVYIASLQVWKSSLKERVFFEKALDYIGETISNLIQNIILGCLGFKIPSCIMLRRSMENLLSFLYYKDHPIEFLRKRNGNFYTSIKDILKYLENYPLEQSETESEKLLKFILDNFRTTYYELSNFVHSSNKEYLVNISKLDEIKPSDETLESLLNLTDKVCSITNGLFTVIFAENYRSLDDTKKKYIRISINDSSLKRKIFEVFKYKDI